MDYREGMQVLRAQQVHAPAIVRFFGGYHVFSRTKRISYGASIEDALRAGGFLPAPNLPAPFTAEDLNVRWKSQPVCTAANKTLAQRIANALNEYVPGKRGN